MANNVQKGIEDDHPNPDFLSAVAKVISDEEPISSLEKQSQMTALSHQLPAEILSDERLL